MRNEYPDNLKPGDKLICIIDHPKWEWIKRNGLAIFAYQNNNTEKYKYVVKDIDNIPISYSKVEMLAFFIKVKEEDKEIIKLLYDK